MNEYRTLLEWYLTKKKGKYSENKFFPCQFVYHKSHVGLNHGFRDEMPATNLLSHDMALSLKVVVAAIDNELSK